MEQLTDLFTNGWEFRYSSQHLVLEAPSRAAARDCVRGKFNILATWATKFGLKDTLVIYPGCPKPYRIPASIVNRGEYMNQLIPVAGIAIAQMKLSKPILDVFAYFLENPQIKGGLVRLSDERQIAVSEASAALIKNATLEDAVQRKRSDFWYPEDLNEINLLTRQRLEINNPDSTIEFSWRGVDRTGTDWRRFTNRYRLVQDDFGVVYQVSVNLGVEAIASPVSVNR